MTTTSSSKSVERRQRLERGARWLACALVLSLLLHALAGVGLWLAGPALFTSALPEEDAPRQAVAMRPLSTADWERHRQVAPPPSARPPNDERRAERKPPLPKQPEPAPKGQVVATAPGNDERPEDSRFLSETNNRVEKETIARERRSDYRSVAPMPSERAPRLPPRPDDSAESLRQESAALPKGGVVSTPEPEPAPALEIPRQEARPERRRVSFEGLSGVPMRFEEQAQAATAIDGNSNRFRMGARPGQSAEPSPDGARGDGTPLVLSPSAAFIHRLGGGPASDVSRDMDVEEGEGTYLNTREWKHASFFNRIKQSVGQHWDPNALIAIQDPTGEAYLYKNRHTLVAVTLDASGNLKSVRVTQQSGVEFLDREALDAFRRAQPFLHPPTALQNDRGEISFSFGFYVEVNRSRMRLFR
ncbi:MAG: TonB family protein [Myxococcales bacterium]|nr:TonB family protein [Myxococcales bacterium]